MTPLLLSPAESIINPTTPQKSKKVTHSGYREEQRTGEMIWPARGHFFGYGTYTQSRYAKTRENK